MGLLLNNIDRYSDIQTDKDNHISLCLYLLYKEREFISKSATSCDQSRRLCHTLYSTIL